jgi:hypothetical protein
MPVARIVGCSSYASELANQLRQRGFEVTFDSDAARAIDLEIKLDECSAEEAVNRAITFADGQDISLLIAPGILDTPNPIREMQSGSEADESGQSLTLPPVEHHSDDLAEPKDLALPLAAMTTADDAAGACAPDTRFSAAVPPAEANGTGQIEAELSTARLDGPEELSDWPIWQIAEEPTQEVQSPEELSPADDPRWFARLRSVCSDIAVAPGMKWLSDERVFNRVAAAAAAIGIAALLLGTLAHRFSPLPARVVQGSSQATQPAPFNHAAVRAGTAAASILQAGVGTASTPAPFAGAPGRRSALAVPGGRAARARRSVADDDYIAANTVVRYNRRASVRQQSGSTTGIKYYTDLKPATH